MFLCLCLHCLTFRYWPVIGRRICEEFWKFWVDLKVKESCYYCNSPYYIKSQINRLQQIWFAHTVVKAPKFSHITPIVRSQHWLDINEHIEYELISLTYEVLTTSQPDYLHNLISVQSTCRTCSSSAVTLARPFVSLSLQIALFHICITLPVESAPFFIPSTSFCSLSSWFTSSCAYHLITVITFALITYHCLYLSRQT